MDQSEARSLTRNVLDEWQAGGADLRQPRRVMNSFRVYSPQALDAFLNRLDSGGYRVANRGELIPDEPAYCMRVETEAVVEPTPAAMDALTDDAARLAEEMGVEYDLWYSTALAPEPADGDAGATARPG